MDILTTEQREAVERCLRLAKEGGWNSLVHKLTEILNYDPQWEGLPTWDDRRSVKSLWFVK